MFGLLNINKPTGPTSRDVVNTIQRLIRPAKVGHAGTLDPLADGVLIVCIGAATRLIDNVQEFPKEYVGNFRLGYVSDTEDIQGELRPVENAPSIARVQLQAALPQFIGTIQQTPPQFSAIKVSGKRAYSLARKGERVKLKSRSVTIEEIELLDYSEPNFSIRVRCHSGTYLRSLGRDIGVALGSGAVMTSLSRTLIGPWNLADAIEQKYFNAIEDVQQNLLPARQAVQNLPSFELTEEENISLGVGGPLPNRTGFEGDEIVGFDNEGRLAAILKPYQDGELLRPARNFYGKN